MKNIFLISGKAQHGKDSVAIILKETFELEGKKVLILHYADYLKFICRQYFGWDGNKDENGRHILQYVGTDIIRKKNPEFWVEIVSKLIDVIEDDYDYFMIPDCRFKNEIDFMKNKYGELAKSIRVSRINFENSLTEEQRLHPSETALDDYHWDFRIGSISGLDNLRKAVNDFIGYLKEIC